MKKFIQDNQTIILALTAVVVGVVIGFFVFGEPEPPETVNVTSLNPETTEAESDDQSNQAPDEAEDDEAENQKTPLLSGNVSEKPIVSSSFGLVEESPVPKGQLVSTSCTTEVDVDCVLEFTNTSTDQLVIFEVKRTTGAGSAIWEWEAGDQLSSGTWSSVAKAGDKSSNPEVIYIQ